MAIKSILLLLLGEDLSSNEGVRKRIDELMKTNPSVKNQKTTKEFLNWVLKEDSGNSFTGSPESITYSWELTTVKNKVIDIYFNKLKELVEENSEFVYSGDIHSELSELVLQLMRIRMVVNPEVQISRNVHPVTNHAYLAAKAFWISDSGEKVRKFTKSLGLASEFEGGREDPKALKKGTALIQEVMFTLYKETYSK